MKSIEIHKSLESIFKNIELIDEALKENKSARYMTTEHATETRQDLREVVDLLANIELNFC